MFSSRIRGLVGTHRIDDAGPLFLGNEETYEAFCKVLAWRLNV